MTIATVVYWLNPPGNPGVDMACMIVIGFLIYGPVMLIGLHAWNWHRKAAGTAAGFTGLFGYRAVRSRRAPSWATPLTSSVGTAALW